MPADDPNLVDLPNKAIRVVKLPAQARFLDAARNDTVWHKASERIKKSGVDVTISLLKEILNQLLKQSLGLP